METKIEMGKQYKTRDGREVRIYATDCGIGDHQVHGAIKRSSCGWMLATWSICGKFRLDCTGSHDYDLIEVKPRIVQELWMNLYPNADGSVYGNVHPTRADADRIRAMGCIACVRVPIDCEEGEGLNNDA